MKSIKRWVSLSSSAECFSLKCSGAGLNPVIVVRILEQTWPSNWDWHPLFESSEFDSNCRVELFRQNPTKTSDYSVLVEQTT